MKFSNEFKIGLVILAASLVAFFGFRFMNDEPLLSSVKLLYTKYDNIDGLVRGSSVFINGYKIGSVRSMDYIIEEDSILVTMSITDPIAIPKGSMAVMADPPLLGSALIRIERANNTEHIEWGGYIQGVKRGGLLQAFSEEGATVADSVQMTLKLVNKTLRSLNTVENNVSKNLESTISNFEKTSRAINDVINERKADVDSMIIAAQHTMQNISDLSDSSSADVEEMIRNLRKFSADLDSLSANLQESTLTMNSILQKMDNGTGTIGLMLNDPSVYTNLDSLTFNLNELILQIKDDPGRYLKHMRLVDIF